MLMPSFLQRGRYTSVRTGIGPSENPLVSKMYKGSVFIFPWVVVQSVVIVLVSVLCHGYMV
jgi:hypothetical protein